jgi:hypothetical protein
LHLAKYLFKFHLLLKAKDETLQSWHSHSLLIFPQLLHTKCVFPLVLFSAATGNEPRQVTTMALLPDNNVMFYFISGQQEGDRYEASQWQSDAYPREPHFPHPPMEDGASVERKYVAGMTRYQVYKLFFSFSLTVEK